MVAGMYLRIKNTGKNEGKGKRSHMCVESKGKEEGRSEVGGETVRGCQSEAVREGGV